MITLNELIAAFLSEREFDASVQSRLVFWSDCFGDQTITDITFDQVDEAIVQLKTRGKLNHLGQPDGKPLKPSTVNRYITQLQSLYRYAKRHRLVTRAFIPPTNGIEKSQERPDPERYFRPEQVERLLAVVRVHDTRWRRMEALITLAYTTGLRKSNLMNLRWRDVDLDARIVTVRRTKNGEPMISPLTNNTAVLVGALPGRADPDALLFGNSNGKPFEFRKLWAKCCSLSNNHGRNFHQLRHGCGHRLAVAGAGQAQIMAVMGHKTLTASARYMHSNVDDKRAVIEKVFG